MTNDLATRKGATNVARQFRATVQQVAGSLISEWVGEDRAAEAAGRITAALAASAGSAKKPEDFYSCTPQSIGVCVATAALTGIMPGSGSTALAYCIPRRARKGERPQLQYQLSHRGIAALAQRSGYSIIAVPVGIADEIELDSTGSATLGKADIDHPPMNIDQLRGVVVRISRGGQLIFAGWIPKSLILQRRDGSDAYQYAAKNDWARQTDPWHKWPVEMAMKTAIHYAVSRGWCVIDDADSARAISLDNQQDYAATDNSNRNALANRLTAMADDGPTLDDSPEHSQEPEHVTDEHGEIIDPEQDEDPEAQEIEGLAKLAVGYGCPEGESQKYARLAMNEDEPPAWLGTKPWAKGKAKQKTIA